MRALRRKYDFIAVTSDGKILCFKDHTLIDTLNTGHELIACGNDHGCFVVVARNGKTWYSNTGDAWATTNITNYNLAGAASRRYNVYGFIHSGADCRTGMPVNCYLIGNLNKTSYSTLFASEGENSNTTETGKYYWAVNRRADTAQGYYFKTINSTIYGASTFAYYWWNFHRYTKEAALLSYDHNTDYGYFHTIGTQYSYSSQNLFQSSSGKLDKTYEVYSVWVYMILSYYVVNGVQFYSFHRMRRRHTYINYWEWLQWGIVTRANGVDKFNEFTNDVEYFKGKYLLACIDCLSWWWVFGYNIRYSSDLNTFTNISMPAPVNRIRALGDYVYVACNNGYLYRSSDGVNYTQVSIGTSAHVRDIA